MDVILGEILLIQHRLSQTGTKPEPHRGPVHTPGQRRTRAHVQPEKKTLLYHDKYEVRSSFCVFCWVSDAHGPGCQSQRLADDTKRNIYQLLTNIFLICGLADIQRPARTFPMQACLSCISYSAWRVKQNIKAIILISSLCVDLWEINEGEIKLCLIMCMLCPPANPLGRTPGGLRTSL